MKMSTDKSTEDVKSNIQWLRNNWRNSTYYCTYLYVERCSSAVECQTRNQVSPGSNHPLLPFRILGIFVLSIDAPVDSAV